MVLTLFRLTDSSSGGGRFLPQSKTLSVYLNFYYLIY